MGAASAPASQPPCSNHPPPLPPPPPFFSGPIGVCVCVSLPPHRIIREDPLAPRLLHPVGSPSPSAPHSPLSPRTPLVLPTRTYRTCQCVRVCVATSDPHHAGDSLAPRLLHPMGAAFPSSHLSPLPSLTPCAPACPPLPQHPPHQDLSVCACVCRYLRTASSEENLWRRAYCIRWGPPPPPPPSSTRSVLDGRGGSGGMGGGGGGGEGSGGGGGGAGGGGAAGAQARSHWKRLYFERDRGEMKEFVADSPQDLRGFYAQLQAAKRNLVPRRDQVYDELVHVTSDLARAVAEWRQQNKLPERVEEAHRCTGGNCTFHRIENVFLCEKTGRAHGECWRNESRRQARRMVCVWVELMGEGEECRRQVDELQHALVCDDNCAELPEDAEGQMLVCAIGQHLPVSPCLPLLPTSIPIFPPTLPVCDDNCAELLEDAESPTLVLCDDNCAELLEDAESQMLVCAISGRCVDRMLSPQEEFDHQRVSVEKVACPWGMCVCCTCVWAGRCVDPMLSPLEELKHQRAAEEAASTCQPEELQEPFMGAGRFGE
ncbi:unnamed protein product [Closterium sp. NIES-65]|nr:unnamed protein product [Closterium sp. NIES-65]